MIASLFLSITDWCLLENLNLWKERGGISRGKTEGLNCFADQTEPQLPQQGVLECVLPTRLVPYWVILGQNRQAFMHYCPVHSAENRYSRKGITLGEHVLCKWGGPWRSRLLKAFSPPASPAAGCKSFFEEACEQYIPTFTIPSKSDKQIIYTHRERPKERVEGGVRERETEKQLISQYFRTLFISKNGKQVC